MRSWFDRFSFAAALAAGVVALAALSASAQTTRPATTRPATTRPATTQPAADQPAHGGGLLGGPVRDRSDEAGRGFNGKRGGGGPRDQLAELDDILDQINLTEAKRDAVREAIAAHQGAVYMHQREVADLEAKRRNAESNGNSERARELTQAVRELRGQQPNREALIERMLKVLSDDEQFRFLNAFMQRSDRDPANRVERAMQSFELTDAQREKIESLTTRYRHDATAFRKANFDKLNDLRRKMALGGESQRDARKAMAELIKQGPAPAYVRSVGQTLDADQRQPFFKAMRTGKPVRLKQSPKLDL